MCKPTTIDTALNIGLDGKVALIPRVVKFTVIRRLGSPPLLGQSNTTILILSGSIRKVGILVPSSSFLIEQKKSMIPIATQTECPAQ